MTRKRGLAGFGSVSLPKVWFPCPLYGNYLGLLKCQYLNQNSGKWIEESLILVSSWVGLSIFKSENYSSGVLLLCVYFAWVHGYIN